MSNVNVQIIGVLRVMALTRLMYVKICMIIYYNKSLQISEMYVYVIKIARS